MYPKDITDAMRDCILAIFWPKDQIYSFLKNHGCTPTDLKGVSDYKNEKMSRVRIIDTVFDALRTRADGGLGQFRAMLRALMEWEHFDPYYFHTLKKLDEAKARRLINHIRQLQEIRDAKIEERRKTAEKTKNAAPRIDLSQIRIAFFEMFSQDASLAQSRGYKLEKILRDIAQLDELETSEPFKVQGEQVDGSIKFDGEHYIIEAKWQDKLTASDALYHFAFKVEGKLYGRGLFISINCYSPDSVQALRNGKALKTILIDGGDLVLVVEGRITFSQMLNAKIKAAQTQGRIYVDPITLQDKHGY